MNQNKENSSIDGLNEKFSSMSEEKFNNLLLGNDNYDIERVGRLAVGKPVEDLIIKEHKRIAKEKGLAHIELGSKDAVHAFWCFSIEERKKFLITTNDETHDLVAQLMQKDKDLLSKKGE